MNTKSLFLFLFATLIILSGCKNKTHNTETNPAKTSPDSIATQQIPNTPEQILAKKQIPVLCYHRITDASKGDYTVSIGTFNEHVKILADSGYHSISPDELYDYLVFNKSLPAHPFMITFDDSRIEHHDIAAPVLEKAGFRGVFFIMTITYNKKNYMTTDQIAELSKAGHTVGLHSWDHTMATKYMTDEDWQKEVAEPLKKLEGIIGKPVDYWAYPNGVSNAKAAAGLKDYFKISFILSTKRDSINPLQTVRRMIVPDISGNALLKSMRRTF
jgi:peptidoglycan/xylan/chitin deacetylase (PgdA/CDA1 family)